MTPLYNPGDKVLTKVQGVEVEACVVRHTVEFEVKTPDGKLWWRASGKVRPVQATPAADGPSAPTTTAAPQASPEPAVSPTPEKPAATVATEDGKKPKKSKKRR